MTEQDNSEAPPIQGMTCCDQAPERKLKWDPGQGSYLCTVCKTHWAPMRFDIRTYDLWIVDFLYRLYGSAPNKIAKIVNVTRHAVSRRLVKLGHNRPPQKRVVEPKADGWVEGMMGNPRDLKK